MLEQALQKVIPKRIDNFRKLTEGHDPYYFASWDRDDGVLILRYWFWNKTRTKKNKKRVFINEVEELLKNSVQARRITRRDFQKHCPRTQGNGPCGFAVIIRILEYFQIVGVVSGVYIVRSEEKIQELINHQ